MKTARALLAALFLVPVAGVQAGETVLTDHYDDYTSKMLKAYQREQEYCGVPGMEHECMAAQYEFEMAARQLDSLQMPACADDSECWGVIESPERN